MSFSSQTKHESCHLPIKKICCAKAEIYGALLYGYAFRPNEVRVVTENTAVPIRLSRLLLLVFGFDFDKQPSKQIPPETQPFSAKQTLALSDRDKLSALFEGIGYEASSSVALHLNNAVLENECCPASFLRGVFLTGGSVTDPEKKYHLELSTPHVSLSREVMALLREIGFTPKSATRAGHTLLYLKASEQIEDFLTTIGAPAAALRLMETKVEKDLRNRVNRKVNCETANLTKTVEAAMRQTEAIGRLRDSPLWETLSPALRETAELRLSYPEEPLTVLCTRFDNTLGRSGLNHRLRKLLEIADSTRAGTLK